MALYGAVEAGGTKFLCAVGEDPARPERLERFDTYDKPAETMRGVLEYFLRQPPLAALGVACFGPLDLAGGRIGRTPKLAWAGFPIREALERELGVKVALDTDVNGAAIGEGVAGAGVGCSDFVYVTVGTGIGGGAVSGGRVVQGAMHPEMGHIPVMRHLGENPDFPGHCHFHGACLEGMASAPAIRARWGKAPQELPDDHPAWVLEAFYLAQACRTLACVLSPELILLGGGVLAREGLLARTRVETVRLLGGYLTAPRIEAPALPYPGLSGALELARRSLL